MINLSWPDPSIRAWVATIAASSGWPKDQNLLVWWGATPWASESGMMEWSGDRPTNPDFERRRQYEGGRYDFVVTLTERSTDLFDECPAFVAWILGHELGHAHLALRNPTEHRLWMFVQDHIRSASNGSIANWWDLAHEAACDRFGLLVASAALGREAVLSGLHGLVAAGRSPIERERLLVAVGQQQLSHMPSLLEEMRSLVKPFEGAFREAWDRELERGDQSRLEGLDIRFLFPDSPGVAR